MPCSRSSSSEVDCWHFEYRVFLRSIACYIQEMWQEVLHPLGTRREAFPFIFAFPALTHHPCSSFSSPLIIFFFSSPNFFFLFFPFWCHRLNPETCMCSTTVLHSSHQCHEFALKTVYYMMGGDSDPI